MNKDNVVIEPLNREHKPLSSYMAEKMKDMLYGFIVGDALGVPYEFKKRAEMEKHPASDMVGGGTHKMPVGTWSDDTSLTLALLDSIAGNKGVNETDIGDKFLSWYFDSKYTATGTVFDCGVTTAIALEKIRDGERPFSAGGAEETDNGNGALMRILPLAFYFTLTKYDKETLRNVAGITHAHEISQKCCEEYMEILMALIGGESISFKEEVPEENTGFVVTTLKAAKWCMMFSSYEEAVLKAVNLGEDTDTVAAVTGSMAGAIWGVPEKWKSAIKNKELIEEVFERFVDSFK